MMQSKNPTNFSGGSVKNIKIITIVLLLSFLMTGCFEGTNYNMKLNASSTGECLKLCADLMNDGHCMRFSSYYSKFSKNKSCDCTLIQCMNITFKIDEGGR